MNEDAYLRPKAKPQPKGWHGASSNSRWEPVPEEWHQVTKERRKRKKKPAPSSCSWVMALFPKWLQKDGPGKGLPQVWPWERASWKNQVLQKGTPYNHDGKPGHCESAPKNCTVAWSQGWTDRTTSKKKTKTHLGDKYGKIGPKKDQHHMISYDIIWGSSASYDAKNASYDAKNSSYEEDSPHMRSYDIIWCLAFFEKKMKTEIVKKKSRIFMFQKKNQGWPHRLLLKPCCVKQLFVLTC